MTWEFAVEWYARLLGADYCVGTSLGADGHISHFWPEGKARWVTELAQRLGIRLDEVVAVGDSSGDVLVLRAVGCPFFVGRML